MTYDNPEIIQIMLENNGVYPGDPQMKLIYQYNIELYAVFMRREHDDMHLSPYVRKYKLLFDADHGGLTKEGKAWLEARHG